MWRWRRYGGMARGGARYLEAPKPPTWAVPWSAWRALASHRRFIPSPLLYLVVAGVGLMLGVVLQCTLGVWSWVPPILLPAAAWLAAFTSLWWRPRAPAGSLRTAILTATDPQRGYEELRREQRECLLNSQLPLFELESWRGSVRLADWGGSPERITHISVGFSDEPDALAVVSVTTVANQGGHEGRMREQLLDELSGRDLNERIGPLASPEAIRDALDQARDELGGQHWTTTVIRIDGRDHPGFAFRGTRGSAAYCAVGDLWVTIEGSSNVDYRLRTVGDRVRLLNAA